MNKAFVREPDDSGRRHCPECGSLGTPTPPGAWRLHVRLPESVSLGEPVFFCPFARCEVVYFDEVGRTVPRGEVTLPVWPKDADAPICACFGFGSEDIEADLAEGGVQRIRELLQKAKSAEADCQRRAPSGQSCIAEAQRYFLRRRAGEPS